MKFLRKFWIIVIGEWCFSIRTEKLALLLILYQLTEVNATFPRLQSDLKPILYITNKIQLNSYFIFFDLNTKKKKKRNQKRMGSWKRRWLVAIWHRKNRLPLKSCARNEVINRIPQQYIIYKFPFLIILNACRAVNHLPVLNCEMVLAIGTVSPACINEYPLAWAMKLAASRRCN